MVTGAFHSCGLRTNGTVDCWGTNTNGQTTVPPGLVATDLVAGLYYTCALPTTGGVKCWGDAVGVSMPMDAVATKPTTGAFVGLFGGDTWACAQASTGTLSCFGANFAFSSRASTYSIGIAANGSSYAAINLVTGQPLVSSGITGTVPTNPPNGHALVDCGEAYCCAVRESRAMPTDRLQGAVQCWGSNTPAAGQTAGRVLNAPPLTTLTAAINAGSYSACAIQSTPSVPATDLTLLCWGSTTDGVVSGRPSGQFVSVSVGSFHACAVELAGGVRCWGSNSSGQAPAFRQ